MLMLFAGKKQMSQKGTEEKDSQEYRSNFRTPVTGLIFPILKIYGKLIQVNIRSIGF